MTAIALRSNVGQRRSRGLVGAFLAFVSFRASTRQVSALGLCALAMVAMIPAIGCSQSEVAQDIVSYTPALQSAVATVASAVSLLEPADAAIVVAATTAFNAGSAAVVAQAKAYLANPSATVLQQLQTAIVTFQQSVNSSLLSAAKIVDPNSQAHITQAIGAVATIATAILGLVERISSKSQVQAMAAASTVKLSQIQPYLPRGQVEAIAQRYHLTPDEFFAQQAQAGF
jgi:hypothetical protein